MLRSVSSRIGSAHVIAFVALCAALGSGYAVAGKGSPEPKPTKGYETSSPGQRTQPADRENLVDQLVLPAKGLYAVSAKLDVAKATGNDFADGAVACHLGGIGTPDSSSVSVGKGEIANIGLQVMGGSKKGSGTQAIDLSCSSVGSSYVVSDVRMSAISLDAARTE